MLKKIFYLLMFFVFFIPFLRAQDDINFDKFKGVNLANFDLSVSPSLNFYRYVNGTWLKNNPCPSDFSRWGSFIILGEETNKILKQILEAAAKMTDTKNQNLRKIGDLYSSCSDSAAIEELGSKPLLPYFQMIDDISSTKELMKILGYLHSYRMGGMFGFFAGQDKKNSEEIIPQFFQGGLSLPNKEYYTKQDDNSKQIREKYTLHIINLFKLLGDNEVTAKNYSETILNIENRLANASMSPVEMRNPEATYNKFMYDELIALYPELNLETYFNSIGLSDKSKFYKGINVGSKDFMKELNIMMKEISLDNWKIYLKWNLVNRSADLLSSDFVIEDFNFNSKVLGGVKEMQPRWKRMLSMVNRAAGELLGQVYVDKMFSPTAKEKASVLVNNILLVMKERIQNLIWMSPETKESALKKLSTFRVKIGYPDKWRDFSTLNFDANSFFENMKRASNFSFNYSLNKIGKPVDRNEWGMSPQTVNAYYSASKNEIVFPAAILQPPFFDVDGDDALNYGGIGAVIGHEITHGFDDQGSKYDASGNMENWWTETDRTQFDKLSLEVVDQYNSFTVLDTVHVNGKLTLGENIADLGGLTLAYYAMLKSISEKDLGLIDGFTQQQRFFISWAQIWRMNATPEMLLMQVNTDPHSPSIFRVNGPLSNMQEFADAFGCKDGDKMFKSNKTIIW